MLIEFYKYQGAGNDFIIADNRDNKIKLATDTIKRLCDRRYGIGADGLMLLENASEHDFKMVYYNSDGSGGMMCGNGGRCIAAFANKCGLPIDRFIAADGEHKALIVDSAGKTLTIKLLMNNVDEITYYDNDDFAGCFMNTGTRHLVVPVHDIELTKVFDRGRHLRYLSEFGPEGVNVNFIEWKNNVLNVRTYEKGVEDETYACGTGITASAIAAWHYKNNPLLLPAHKFDIQPPTNAGENVCIPIKALRDNLAVEFTPTSNAAKDVWLTGPATEVAKILIDIY